MISVLFGDLAFRATMASHRFPGDAALPRTTMRSKRSDPAWKVCYARLA